MTGKHFGIIVYKPQNSKGFGESLKRREVTRDMNKSKKASIASSHIRFGKRTYFFDINLTKAEDQKYLKITESRFVEEGKPRLHNSFILFPENVADFQKSMAEISNHLG